MPNNICTRTHCWHEFEKAGMLKNITLNVLSTWRNRRGVYALHIDHEWLYIGSTKDFLKRIIGNHFCGIGGNTTKRINREVIIDEEIFPRLHVGYFDSDTYRLCEQAKILEFNPKRNLRSSNS